MKTLIKTLDVERGKLMAVRDGRRVMICECSARAEVYEVSANVPVLGVVGYEIKLTYNAALRCADGIATRPLDAEYLRSVSRFELIGDIQRAGGEYERMVFDCIGLDGFDLHRGTWEFGITDRGMVDRLLVF